jgi:hypothetical protein
MNKRLHVYTNIALTIIGAALIAIILILLSSKACAC